jgi:hypothetical protein
MENLNQKSVELEAFRRMNQRKTETMAPDNLLEAIACLPAKGITASNLDWEIGKNKISLVIEIDRGTATETITWELKAKKGK